MKFASLIAIFVSTCISISQSNPNLRKGELMETIITKQTQGNYEEMINLFTQIGKLAENHTVDLSEKERKIYFDCYQYRRVQLLKDVVDPENYLNKEVVQKMLLLFSLIENINENLNPFDNSDVSFIYKTFNIKVFADKLHFEAWYIKPIGHGSKIDKSTGKYLEVIDNFKFMLNDADITVLDACLGCSVTKMEYDVIQDSRVYTNTEACNTATNCLSRGRIASSEGNPDLLPLTKLVSTYCKPNPPSILDNYKYNVKE